jgi:hypothetical protein
MRADAVNLGAAIPHLIEFENLALACSSACEPISYVDCASWTDRFEARLAKTDGLFWCVFEALHLILLSNEAVQKGPRSG